MIRKAYKKKLGSWGEEQVDFWMKTNNWNSIAKNLIIPGGEIDRIYQHNQINSRYCIAEIKTNSIYSENYLNKMFSEISIKKFIKQKQIKNLFKLGEKYLALGYKNVYLRIFIVIKINNKTILKNQIENFSFAKICYSNNEYFILSIEPGYVFSHYNKSILQIKI